MKTTTEIHQILREEALYGQALTSLDRRQIGEIYDGGYGLAPGQELWIRYVVNENRDCSPLSRLEELRAILSEHRARRLIDTQRPRSGLWL